MVFSGWIWMTCLTVKQIVKSTCHSFCPDVFCCIAMNNTTYTYADACRIITITQWRRATQFFRKIYLSLSWKGSKGLLKILLCESWVGGWKELQHIDPHSYSHNSVSFPFFWAAQPGGWGPSLSGTCFSFQHLLSNWMNFVCTELYINLTSTLLPASVTISDPIQPVHGQFYILIYRMHLLFTQMHFLFDSLVGSEVNIQYFNWDFGDEWTVCKIRGSLDKFLNFFRMGIFIDSTLRSNLLRLQYTCFTGPITSGRPHKSTLVWACQWPLSHPFSSSQLSHNDSLWALGISKSHGEQGLDYKKAKELSWCSSWSNNLRQGWSCGLVHCPGGNAIDPI